MNAGSDQDPVGGTPLERRLDVDTPKRGLKCVCEADTNGLHPHVAGVLISNTGDDVDNPRSAPPVR